MTKTNDVETIMESFYALKRTMYKNFEPLLKAHDLSLQQWQMLLQLSHHDAGLSTSDLAEATHITPGAVSQCTDQLIDKGLVERQIDQQDRRRICLKLSQQGTDQLTALHHQYRSIISARFASLTAEELHLLANLMYKISQPTAN